MTQPSGSDQHGPAPGARRGHGLAISGIVFVVLLIAVASLVLLSLRQSLHPAHHDEGTQRHQGVEELDVNARSSNITLVAAPAGSRTVSVARKLAWNRAKPTVETHDEAHRLTVTARCDESRNWGFANCRADVTITLPANVPVTVRTDSGDTSVQRLTGTVAVQASSGDVDLVGTSGAVDVRAESGDIRGTDLRSAITRAAVSSGNVSLTFLEAPDSLTASATSGDVTLVVPKISDGYAMSVNVSSGDKTVLVADRAGSAHQVSAEVSSGNVTVDYPGADHDGQPPGS